MLCVLRDLCGEKGYLTIAQKRPQLIEHVHKLYG